MASSIWFQIGSAPLLETVAGAERIDREQLFGGLPGVFGTARFGRDCRGVGRFQTGRFPSAHLQLLRLLVEVPPGGLPTVWRARPKQLSSVRAPENWPWARIDTCRSCRQYLKTFDLREPAGNEVVPQVDGVATLPLDLWAQDQGYRRVVPPSAGV